MEVIEKYPLSRRLDHPGFGEVCKTTFAKGTITDFEKISDDPIQVKSRVKVTGDFGESDYIPTFYHPKSGYWDDETAAPPVLATDFDEETGAFKQAWMSFRVDDEVIVMLKEGVPVAVMGFADGVPRIGENILKMEDKETEDPDNLYYLRMDRGEEAADINSTEKGPDNLDLGLKLEIEPAEGNEGTKVIPTDYISRAGSQVVGGGSAVCGFNSYFWADDPAYGDRDAGYPGCVASAWWPEGPKTVDEYIPPVTNLYYREVNMTEAVKVLVWPVVVGPVLFAVYLLVSSSYGTANDMWAKDVAIFLGDGLQEWIDNGGPPAAAGVAGIWGTSNTFPPGDWGVHSVLVKAGVYTKELLEQTLASVNTGNPIAAKDIVDGAVGDEIVDWWPNAPAKLILQEELTRRFDKYSWQGATLPSGEPCSRCPYFNPVFDVVSETLRWPSFFTRPHTKAELEEAGMWPAPE